uniref:Fucosyltransferase n=1 Tax=Timema bartmani TaxID=61472 RepID=A0A7R9HY07_9NEOP|nr:unnamed protein product [Timema bartmani]
MGEFISESSSMYVDYSKEFSGIERGKDGTMKMTQPFCSKKCLCFFAAPFFTIYTVGYLWLTSWGTSQHLNTKETPLKTILLWNQFFSTKHFGYGIGQDPFLKAQCPVHTCNISDRADGPLHAGVEHFDAILFHMIDKSIIELQQDMPDKRSAHQRYIFFLQESPGMHATPVKFPNFFNWTVTYRRDSDIYIPYGFVTAGQKYPDAKSPNPVFTGWMVPNYSRLEKIKKVSSKSKLVAWFVSNCYSQSRRISYVRELSKYIPVDIYGDCGNLVCPRSKEDECYQMLNTSYKFYLAFENSLCKDYVTEKLFNVMNYDVVPVTYGGVDYTVVAPPMSYIDVLKFESPKKLAHYLKYLDKNPVEYHKYFWWKKYYKVNTQNKHVLCKLCEMLHDSRIPPKIYEDIEGWWRPKSICRAPDIKDDYALNLNELVEPSQKEKICIIQVGSVAIRSTGELNLSQEIGTLF